MSKMSKIIGIDLGTTNSCVAIMEGSTPKVVINEDGNRTTPSVVAFQEDDVPLVGESARRQAVVNSKKTVFSAKRFIGSKYSEVKGIAETMPFDVVKSKGDEIKISIGDKKYSPSEVSAKILTKLKQAAEEYLGEKVSEAVITVPAYFNDSQRQATKDAGKIAGLDVKRIINEPTAAALAYGLDKNKNEIIAVYDFGGGTFDVSILEVGDNVVEVLSTNGDTHLGGDNIDEILIDYLAKDFKKSSGVDVSEDSMALQRLREAAEDTKKSLSTKSEVEVSLPFLTADSTGPKHLLTKISRSKFNRMISSIIKKTFSSCKTALSDSGKKAEDIDQVVLVGGSTRIPLVLKEVTKFFGKDPNRGVNPDEVVALGAAIQGGVLSGDVKDILLLDVTPLSLGIETMGGVCTVLIPKNTTIPTKKSEIFSTADHNQTAVDVHVLQGERSMAPDNRSLGNFRLDGLPPAPRGMPQIEVSFDLDADGILSVSAVDKATGKEQKITITSSGGLSDSEIEQMIQDAKENEELDVNRKKLVEARNALDSMIYAAEQLKADDSVPDESKTKIDDVLVHAQEALKSADVVLIEELTGSLSEIISSVNVEKWAEQNDGVQPSFEDTGYPAPETVVVTPESARGDDAEVI
jgi:molecular chaperone DnaK